jgi:hypothetical protein
LKSAIGYESLTRAIRSLSLDEAALDQALGYLLSLAFADFSFSDVFVTLRNTSADDFNGYLADVASRLTLLRNPSAFRVLWDLLPLDMPTFTHATYHLAERLCAHIHRNHVVLAGLGLGADVFARFCAARQTGTLTDSERSIMQKLLRRLLESGVTRTDEAREIFQRAVGEDDRLDADVLEIVRPAMKAKWPSHFSMEGSAAFVLAEESVRGMPVNGFTFMVSVMALGMRDDSHSLLKAWLLFEKLPTEGLYSIFGLRVPSGWIIQLALRPDGTLELVSSGHKEAFVFSKAPLPVSRWFHLTLVHHPHRATNPTVRKSTLTFPASNTIADGAVGIFIDGVLTTGVNWQYPKPLSTSLPGAYVVGDDDALGNASWCLASTHLFSIPLHDDLPRLVHHLGPRYVGNFQSTTLVRFLTYEASTSLNIHLSSLVSTTRPAQGLSPLMKAIKDGMGVSEAVIMFALNPASLQASEPQQAKWDGNQQERRGWDMKGDVYLAPAYCLDLALWKLGGASIPLRLVQLTDVSISICFSGKHETDGFPRVLMSFLARWAFCLTVCGIAGRTLRIWNVSVCTHTFIRNGCAVLILGDRRV